MWYIMRTIEPPIAKETDSYRSPKGIVGELYLNLSIRRLEVFMDIPLGQHFKSVRELADALKIHSKNIPVRQFKAIRYHIIKTVAEGMKANASPTS